jgi:hypothetical protein
MSSEFLSGYNLDYLYNQIRVNIITEINYNLDDNSQYKTMLIPKLASVVFNKYRNYDVTELNELAIKATTEHIVKTRLKKTETISEKQTEIKLKTKTKTLYDEEVVDVHSFSRNNLDLLDVEENNFDHGYLISQESSILDRDTHVNEHIVDNKLTEESFPYHNQVNSNETKVLNETDLKIEKEVETETEIDIFETVIERTEEDTEDAEFFKKLMGKNEELVVNSQHNQLPKQLKDEDYDSTKDSSLFTFGLTDQTVRDKIKYTIQNQSNGNLMEGYDPNRPIIPETHINLTNNKLDSTLNLHSKGSSEMRPYMVILDVLPDSGIFATGDEFQNIQCRLINTFKISKKYDVYLEFISLHDIVGATATDNIENYHSFILKINELRSLNTLSNNNQFIDSLIIPNETYGTSNLESSIGATSITAFAEIFPATTFNHATGHTATDDIDANGDIIYINSTKTLTFKATFASGTSLVLIAGDKLSFTYAGTLTDGTYTGTVATNVTITSATNSQSITFTEGLILEGTTTALEDSAADDIFKFLGKSVGNTTSASAKLTSMVVRLKSNYICTQEATSFRDFTITLSGIKSSDSITTTAGILKANGPSTRLQIGLFFKPH